MTHDDLPSILRICTITSREHARGDRFTAEHVIPLLYAEPFVMIDGAYGFIVEEGSRVVGYAIGVIDLPAMHDRLSAYVRARIGRVLSAYAGALVRGQMRWPLRQHRQFLAQMFGCWNVGPAAAEMRDVFRRMFSEAHFDAQVRDCCHLQVDPESRRKGIGVVLVSAWTEFLRAQGAAGVAFNVRRFQSFDELLDAGAPQESGRLLAELGFSDAGGGRWVLRFADARAHAAAS
jgi:GNAT superfamily N-acetyltransferase